MLEKTFAMTVCVLLVAASAFGADRTVIVGDAPIHLAESGNGPTVVFESGMGEGPEVWGDVLPAVAKSAHTVAYDRPGIGQSPATARPRTVVQMATDLHDLLRAAKIAPPYVLVGHSLGGAIVQVYCHRYPREISGLVLVDPEDGRLIEALHTRMSQADWSARQKALEQALPAMPPPVRAELEAGKASGRAVAESSPFPRVPIVLLTGTQKNPDFPGNPLEQDLKVQLHERLVAQNPQVKHVLVPNSRHYIQYDAPQAVIEGVIEVLKAGQRPSAPD